MAIEIERKFLVTGTAWRAAATSSRRITQFYLTVDKRSSVRIRIDDDTRAWLTIKAATSGVARPEFEYPLPVEDAHAMAPLAEGATIDKVRHIVPHGGLNWEVDVFAGENQGLTIAEVELTSETQALAIPDWAGAEITEDRRYYNASLVQRPFNAW